MTEMLEAVVSWQNLLLVLLVFGFAPGFVLRLLVRIYPEDDPRRLDLVAELYVVSRVEQPLFVAEQLATVLVEGVPHRVKAVLSSFRSTTAKSNAETLCGKHAGAYRQPWFYGGADCLDCKSAKARGERL